MMAQMLRNLMPSKTRSSEGCWTCRLRRKKCDERRPICDNCGQLEINCLYSEEKPEWMDNGPKQAARAEQVKAEVKEQARARREKKHKTILQAAGDRDNGPRPSTRDRFLWSSHSQAALQQPQNQQAALPPLPPLPPVPPKLANMTAGLAPMAAPCDTPCNKQPMAGINYNTVGNGGSAQHWAQNSYQLDWDPSERFAGMELDTEDDSVVNTDSPCSKGTSNSHTSSGNNTQPSECSMSSPQQQHFEPSPTLVPNDQSTYYVVIYMDYVFPYLFPHYRPRILEGGRGWLLALLQHNKALFHTAVSFSSYLFAAIYNLENPDYQESTNQLWHQLQKRQEMALQELQQDMASINACGIHGNLQEGARVLESIMQLLVFDVSIGNMEHWDLHLDAAIALFQQLVPNVESWPEVISGLTKGFSQPIPGNVHPMGTDLTAFRFFSGVLMYVDVISSTVLQRAPRLQAYWTRLLPCSASLIPVYSALSPVQMESIMGCQNWMIKYIGEIAALDAWKKEQKCMGTFSIQSLVLQAQMIEQGIRKAAETLAAEDPEHDINNPASVPPLVMPIHQVGCPLGRKKAQAFGDFGNKTRDLIPLTTQIWASASLVYLRTIVSGWVPSSPEIKLGVLTTLNLLEELPSPMFLQSVCWPYLTAGCLAPPELQSRFRMLEKNMGVIKVSETTRKAVGVMEEMWKRGDLEAEFDMATAFRIFGSPFLAI